MKIRKNYFTENQELIRLQTEEIERENLEMTDEKRREKAEAIQRRWKKLYTDFVKKQKHIKRIVNKQKNELFQNMALEAISWAEGINADLSADITEEFQGKIEFKTNMIILDDETPKEYYSYFLQLIETADEFYLFAEEEVLIMKFFYKLYDEIHV